MSEARRAIIMAAGKGERMRPITETVPKPLVKVRGRRMIDTIIDALHQNGITEIYVVVGYLKEQFRDLENQYPGLRLIENPDYDTANNISSLYYARAYLGECVILDGDQIIRDASILNPAFDRSCYCCWWTDSPTEEWVLTLDEAGVVTDCATSGAEKGWELHSISFWSREDGERLRRHLEYEYDDRRNRGIYWDNVALLCHSQEYELGIRPISPEAMVEIDSMQELCQIDPSYQQV